MKTRYLNENVSVSCKKLSMQEMCMFGHQTFRKYLAFWFDAMAPSDLA